MGTSWKTLVLLFAFLTLLYSLPKRPEPHHRMDRETLIQMKRAERVKPVKKVNKPFKLEFPAHTFKLETSAVTSSLKNKDESSLFPKNSYGQ